MRARERGFQSVAAHAHVVVVQPIGGGAISIHLHARDAASLARGADAPTTGAVLYLPFDVGGVVPPSIGDAAIPARFQSSVAAGPFHVVVRRYGANGLDPDPAVHVVPAIHVLVGVFHCASIPVTEDDSSAGSPALLHVVVSDPLERRPRRQKRRHRTEGDQSERNKRFFLVCWFSHSIPPFSNLPLLRHRGNGPSAIWF